MFLLIAIYESSQHQQFEYDFEKLFSVDHPLIQSDFDVGSISFLINEDYNQEAKDFIQRNNITHFPTLIIAQENPDFEHIEITRLEGNVGFDTMKEVMLLVLNDEVRDLNGTSSTTGIIPNGQTIELPASQKRKFYKKGAIINFFDMPAWLNLPNWFKYVYWILMGLIIFFVGKFFGEIFKKR